MGRTQINDGKHIWNVINKHPCKRHYSEVGEPCFDQEVGESRILGICSSRITQIWGGTPTKSRKKAGKK